MQANIAIRDESGRLVFGSLEHIDGLELLIRADIFSMAAQRIEFRLEMTHRGAWISGEMEILAVSTGRRMMGVPLVRCRIVRMSIEDAQVMRSWIEEVDSGGTSQHPGRWVDALSESHSTLSHSRSRSAFRQALRERVRQMRERQE